MTCGATSRPAAQTDLRYVFSRKLLIHGTFMGSRATLHDIFRLISAQRPRPVVHEIFARGDVRRSHELMKQSAHFGKLILVP